MTVAVRRSPEELWTGFLAQVQGKLSNHVLETWLRPVRCTAYDNSTVTLQVRDQFFRDWLADHYLDFIRDELSTFSGEPLAVEWAISPEPRQTAVSSSAASIAASAAASIDEDKSGVSESIHQAAGERRRLLNPRYSFDTFVAGPSNQFAAAACKAVAENPAHSYNPLFIFGGVGLGKTHLLSAIGHHILGQDSGTRIIYTSSEMFMNEVINAVRFSKLDEFHHKYRKNCDVLLMDDIQLISGKERTQNEFFHIFNTLYDSQRQIVVTSDKLPHEIPEIEERLRTRFQWGLIADIQPPEIETRIAILRKKAESDGFVLTDDVSFFLAKSIRSNVRELEGALVRIVAHASLTNTALSVDYARQVLADILSSKAAQVSVESIQKMVATYYQVRVIDLKSARRVKTLVRPRQVAMYLCRKHAGASYPELGSRFGDKDHTTIMSACKKVETQLKADPTLRGQVLELERQLDVQNKS
jgi:chromosomal replication initiator protein